MKNLPKILAAAALLALMGQGCSMSSGTQVNLNRSEPTSPPTVNGPTSPPPGTMVNTTVNVNSNY